MTEARKALSATNQNSCNRAPGSKFSILPSYHLRVATNRLTDRCAEAAEAIALSHRL